MVLAIFQFAKKAPELLKTLLPGNLDSGIGFGISTPKKFLQDKPIAARGLGLVSSGFNSGQRLLRRGLGNA